MSDLRPYMTPPPGSDGPEGGRGDSTESISLAPARVHALAWTLAPLGSDLVGRATLTDLATVWLAELVWRGDRLRVLGVPPRLERAARVALDRLVLDPRWRRAWRWA